jgi:hypothetical protein
LEAGLNQHLATRQTKPRPVRGFFFPNLRDRLSRAKRTSRTVLRQSRAQALALAIIEH